MLEQMLLIFLFIQFCRPWQPTSLFCNEALIHSLALGPRNCDKVYILVLYLLLAVYITDVVFSIKSLKKNINLLGTGMSSIILPIKHIVVGLADQMVLKWQVL